MSNARNRSSGIAAPVDLIRPKAAVGVYIQSRRDMTVEPMLAAVGSRGAMLYGSEAAALPMWRQIRLEPDCISASCINRHESACPLSSRKEAESPSTTLSSLLDMIVARIRQDSSNGYNRQVVLRYPMKWNGVRRDRFATLASVSGIPIFADGAEEDHSGSGCVGGWNLIQPATHLARDAAGTYPAITPHLADQLWIPSTPGEGTYSKYMVAPYVENNE